MDSKWLEEFYGIKTERQMSYGGFDGFVSNNSIYVMKSLGENKDHLEELSEIARHLMQTGDRYVLNFKQTKDGNLWGEKDGKSFCLLTSPLSEKRTNQQIGRKLAKFHVRGLAISFKVERTSRIGQWKELWVKRLEQMEGVWYKKVQQAPENDFDKLFIESFPYYMSLTENAIQYLVDTEMDETPNQLDNGTVCHERFSKRIWGNEKNWKNPFDWVFDHRSRDLAEWTREAYFESKFAYHQEVKKFYKNYQEIAPLSPFAWRLLYSRLIFPLHYFECIEGYYLAQTDQTRNLMEEKLKKHLQNSSDYEKFIGDFFSLIDVPIRKMKIPLIDWIALS